MFVVNGGEYMLHQVSPQTMHHLEPSPIRHHAPSHAMLHLTRLLRYRFCRGCRMECDSTPFRPGTASLYVAVDWDPTALHLRYQSSQERAHVDDESVALSRHLGWFEDYRTII